MKFVFIIAALILAGCAGAPVVTTIRVPVPVACQETVPDRPAMPTEEFKAKPTLDQFAQASMAELERREGYEKKMRAALEGCTAPIK
jgi:uncharacterized lipoprotein YajG